MAPNIPPLLEAHFGVPMAGAVLNALNIRLEPRTIRFILEHGEATALLIDSALARTMKPALAGLEGRLLVVDIVDEADSSERLGRLDYEALLKEGDAQAPPQLPEDEWQALSLSYSSGTTGDPKGVVYHHRGAYLNALGNAFLLGLRPRSVYLWTLPMFHCNGWSHSWAVTAAGGTHVCLRRVEPGEVFRLIEEERVTHMAAAPVVLNMLVHAPEELRRRFAHQVEVATGGAAPPSSVITAMEEMGFRITHLYGLTETYGPATIAMPQTGWNGLPSSERAARMARQGVRYPTTAGLEVVDPGTMAPVAADGEAMGEIVLRGNTVMKGYLKNPEATAEAFRGGWYHTGDLAVRHSDGYVEVKDRAKDIIISGGENVSSLEVEEVLHRHPGIMEAAVVACPDPRWGEVPCAFVTAMADARELDAAAVIAWCREHLAGFKAPRRVVFGPLPKTATGKIQKYELRERARELAG